MTRLDPPAVSPDVYDETYYRGCCAGHEEWSRSGGAEADATYRGSLEKGGLRPGETVVDIGTGRGELLAVAVEAGAASAIGIEYSADAVKLAEHTLQVRAAGDSARVLLADARAVPLPDACADLVTLLDVVEHLTPAELQDSLSETHRLLRPGGRLLIHTLPNRLLYDVVYRLQRSLLPTRRRAWPADPRNDFERLMHVNEQSVFSLRRAVRRAGFRDGRAWTGDWVHDAFVPEGGPRRTYHRLAARRATAWLGAADIWAMATRA